MIVLDIAAPICMPIGLCYYGGEHTLLNNLQRQPARWLLLRTH